MYEDIRTALVTGATGLLGNHLGQGIEVIGALTALIAGVIATRANIRAQAHGS
jgi:thioester reductase-like protein